MHSVLLRLQNQAEVYKEMQKMRYEWLWRANMVLNQNRKTQNVFKRLGLWNMKDEDFYANAKVFEYVLTVINMCLLYAIFSVKHYKKLNPKNPCVFNSTIDVLPIECLNTGEFVYELKAPFTKEFFEKLINNECNILEFGTDYIFKQNGITYGTYKLFELFSNQNFTNYGSN